MFRSSVLLLSLLTPALSILYTNYMEDALAPQETLAKADAVVPRFNWADGKKRDYLSYRLCGYGRDEACNFVGITRRTIYHWMEKDAAFKGIEQTNLLDLRKEFAKEVVALDFSRNYKLVMDHDHEVLKRVRAGDKLGGLVTKEDQEYLNRIRPLYTPQQMQALESMFKDQNNEPQSWDAMLIMIRKTHATVQEEAQYTDEAQRGLEEYPQGTVVEGRLAGNEA